MNRSDCPEEGGEEKSQRSVANDDDEVQRTERERESIWGKQGKQLKGIR